MRILFMGTGGSEGLPALFCNCATCKNAREKRGKEIRTRMGMLVNDDLAIDFSADTYLHILNNGLDFSAVSTLLVTHSHEDHFYPYDLACRTPSTSRDRTVDVMDVYANKEVHQMFNTVPWLNAEVRRNVQFHEIEDGAIIEKDGYKITAFKTVHMSTDEKALIYLIEKEGKMYFHICDSGEPYEEVYEYLAKNNVKLDAVTMDCTFGNLTKEYGGHMNVWQNIRVRDRLKEIGAITDETKVCLTHISHFGGDTYDSLNKTALANGFILAYDGMALEI